MSGPNTETIALLNDLIDTCKDGEKGYREAAEGIENPFYRMLFTDYARQRAKFASELKAQVVRMGDQPDRKGTVKGTIHRGWMNLRAAIAGHNDDLIVAECRRGEEIAIKQYKEALQHNLPANLKALLEQQMSEIMSTEKRVQVMDSKKKVK
jgi:uncharacterized protein (TIGR02284 family)